MAAHSTPRTIRQVHIPHGSLIAQAFATPDYADAYAIRLSPESATDVDALVRTLFSARPRWIDALMALRNRLVRLIGLKTPPRGAHEREIRNLQPGSVAGIFHVLARNDEEIVLGEDDRHLDFRLSVLVRRQAGVAWAVVTTVVRFNGRLGRAYFVPVRPFHQLIVPAMLRNMQRALRGART